MSPTLMMLVGSGTLTVLACAAMAYLVLVAEESPFSRFLGRYEARLEQHTRFLLFSRVTGSQIARLQFITVAIVLACYLVFRSLPLLGLATAVALLPQVRLKKMHEIRVARIEQTLDTWLMMLANALKATPAIGDAIASTVNLVPAPFSEEVDLVVKQNQLGTAVDRAVKNMDMRVGSPVVSGALAMIVVGRETGGDLPEILETSAASLREAARLEAVLRTKTAEGRAQLLVLALFPFLLCGLILWSSPDWFDPMFESQVGRLILAACVAVWAIAVFLAHRIIQVDL